MIALLLSVVVSFQVVNKAVYTHTHILDDGTLMAHAHPYNKQSDSSPYKNHHHSQYEIAFLQQANYLFLIFLGILSLSLFSESRILHEKIRDTYFSFYILFSQGRSPPNDRL